MESHQTNEVVLIVCRRFEVRVESNHFRDEGVALLLDFLPRAVLTGVQPLALAVVDGLGRGRPESGGRQKTRKGDIITSLEVETWP